MSSLLHRLVQCARLAMLSTAPTVVALGLAGAGTLLATGCSSSPVDNGEVTNGRDNGTGDSSANDPAMQRQLAELEATVSDLRDQLDANERELSAAQGLAESQRSTIATLEEERSELLDEIRAQSEQIDELRRELAANRGPMPLTFEELTPVVVSNEGRPGQPDGYTRHDASGFGLDAPGDWETTVRQSLNVVEFALQSPAGDAELTIQVWAHPKWASQEAIANELRQWLSEQVTSRRDAGMSANARRQPDAEGARSLVAGQPTVEAEYVFANEEGFYWAHRRTQIVLMEGSSDVYRSIQADLVYEANDQSRMRALEGVWDRVLRSVWLPGE